MKTFAWSTMAEFEAWHQEIKTALELPKPGINAETGEIDPEAQWTNNYTEPITDQTNGIVAFVEDSVVGISTLIGQEITYQPPKSQM